MADTYRDDIQAKNELIYILSKQGYAPYSKLLKKFYVHLVDDENTIGAMIPDKYIMLINRNLTKKQASFVVRHEILHQYLDHALRSIEHLGEEVYNGRSAQMHKNLNIAQDYEISDLGATEDDYEVIRNLNGLLLCDDHPEWIGMSFEEIYDEISRDNLDDMLNNNSEDNESDENNNSSDGENQDNEHSPDYIEGWNELCDILDTREIDLNSILEDN